MTTSVQGIRGEIAGVAREMPVRGLVTATVGNVSARWRDGMLVTPSRRPYHELRPADVVRMSLEGAVLEATPLDPSLEWRLHAAVYRARPDVAAVVHTHSPFATARSFDPAPLVVETEERRYLGLDVIEVALAWPSGSDELAEAAVEALDERAAVLLAGHGVVAVGPTVRAALELCWTVEHQALIAHLVHGGPTGAPAAPGLLGGLSSGRSRQT